MNPRIFLCESSTLSRQTPAERALVRTYAMMNPSSGNRPGKGFNGTFGTQRFFGQQFSFVKTMIRRFGSFGTLFFRVPNAYCAGAAS